MSESNQQFQIDLKQLLLGTLLFAAYFALMRTSDASLTDTLLGALFLAIRYPCVALAHRLFFTTPLLILALVIPAVIHFDYIAHQWNAPHSRWSSGDWVALPIGYSVFPIVVFLLDASTGKSRTNRQNWMRLAIELFVVLPIWMSIIVACAVKLGSIP